MLFSVLPHSFTPPYREFIQSKSNFSDLVEKKKLFTLSIIWNSSLQLRHFTSQIMHLTLSVPQAIDQA